MRKVRHCVYVATCAVNSKSYVGKAKIAKDRWDQHRADSRRERPLSAFGRALKKYGVESFVFQVIEEYSTESEALEQEPFWIQLLGTMAPNGYNVSPGGDGAQHTVATRRKMSATRKGKPHSPEHNAAVAASLRGRPPPANARNVGGYKLSEETRAKMSACRKGRPRSPETIAKMSAARKGGTISEEQKAKISATLKGRKLSPEAQANYTAAMANPQTRAKWRAAWESRRQRKADDPAE